MDRLTHETQKPGTFLALDFYKKYGRIPGMSSVDERNARLDDLSAAVSSWANKRRDELKARVDANKKILKARAGSERLAQASVSAAKDLVVNEIDAFLVT